MQQNPLKLNFDSLRSNLSSQFDELRKVSLETDKSFIGALNAQEKKQKKGIDDLEKKLNKAEKKNHEAEIESIRSIYNYLHPFNINQERYLNFGNFYSCKGPSFINYIVEKISIMDDKILSAPSMTTLEDIYFGADIFQYDYYHTVKTVK